LITSDRERTLEGALRQKTGSEIARLEKAVALRWFQRAAEGGNPEALMIFGSALSGARGLPKRAKSEFLPIHFERG
jgi:TPR repeat protein